MLVRVCGSAVERSATIFNIDLDIEPWRRDKLLWKYAGYEVPTLSNILFYFLIIGKKIK
jgi:hypothetical protein